MSKIFKRLLGLAAVGGAAAAGVIYYLNKSDKSGDDFLDDLDDDFDLDDDLNPAAEREYVSLNTDAKAENKEEDGEAQAGDEENGSSAEETEDTPADTGAEDTGEDKAPAEK